MGLAVADLIATHNEVAKPTFQDSAGRITPRDFGVAEGGTRDPPTFKVFKCPWGRSYEETSHFYSDFRVKHRHEPSGSAYKLPEDRKASQRPDPPTIDSTTFEALPNVPRSTLVPARRVWTFEKTINRDQDDSHDLVCVDLSHPAWIGLYKFGPPLLCEL